MLFGGDTVSPSKPPPSPEVDLVGESKVGLLRPEGERGDLKMPGGEVVNDDCRLEGERGTTRGLLPILVIRIPPAVRGLLPDSGLPNSKKLLERIALVGDVPW